MNYAIPTAEEIKKYIIAILSDSDTGALDKEERLLRGMRIIWSAMTILHETELRDHKITKKYEDQPHDDDEMNVASTGKHHTDACLGDFKVIGFYAIIMSYWMETERVSELKVAFGDHKCFEPAWEIAKAVHGSVYKDELLCNLVRLYLDVGRCLGHDDYAHLLDKRLLRITEHRNLILERFGTKLNIVLLADALLVCHAQAQQRPSARKRQIAKAHAEEIDTHLAAQIVDVLFEPARQNKSNRNWDGVTPQGIHAMWVATTFYLETALPKKLRVPSFYILCMHDFVEDFISGKELVEKLVEGCSEADRRKIVKGVMNMTFWRGFSGEAQFLFKRSKLSVLHKSVDKCSNLMDGMWMDRAKMRKYCRHCARIHDVTSTHYAAYGPLFIINAAFVVTNHKREMLLPRRAQSKSNK